MAREEKYKEYIMKLRNMDLRELLKIANKSTTGKKELLQSRSLELLKKGNFTPAIRNKIKILLINSNKGICRSNVPRNNKEAQICFDSEMPTDLTSNSALPHLNEYRDSGCPPELEFNHSLLAEKLIKNDDDSKIEFCFQKLSFFNIIDELLEPTILENRGKKMNVANLKFYLNHKQADLISKSYTTLSNGEIEYRHQIQLRFLLLNESEKDTSENFSSEMSLLINFQKFEPNDYLEFVKINVPIDITAWSRFQNNDIEISWKPNDSNKYAVGIFLVRKLSVEELLDKLKEKELKPAIYTKTLVKENLTEEIDSDISTIGVKASLLCPLGLMRMRLPCRSTNCDHIQCFDGQLFIQMNERKPTWSCPVCNKSIDFDSIFIDEYFSDILKVCSGKCTEVEFLKGGTWKPVDDELVNQKKVISNKSPESVHSADKRGEKRRK